MIFLAMVSASSLLPDVPTPDESGVKGDDVGSRFAAYVSAAAPIPIVTRRRAPIVNAIDTPAAKSRLTVSGAEPFTTPPEGFAKFQAAEWRKWGKMIQAAGIERE